MIILRAKRFWFALLGAAVATAGGLQAAETVTVVTTGKGSSLEWPLFIAIHKGFFAAQGVNVDLSSSPSTAAAMQQVAAGAAQIGSGGLTEPIRAIDHGARMSVLLLETAVPPYSLWGKPTLRKISDLRGKLIIVGGIKDITRIYLEQMTGPSGLKPADYDLTYAGTTPARFAALASGAVDAAILYPPASFKAASDGYSKLGELSDYVTDLPFSGYAVNVAWAMQHKASVAGFVKGIGQGVTWFYDPDHRAEAIDLMTGESGADRADIEKSYDYFTAIHMYPDHTTLAPGMIASLVNVLAVAGDLDGSAEPARFVDPDIQTLVDQIK